MGSVVAQGIFFAESDREWVLEGAAVRVSMVGFGVMEEGEARTLDGKNVAKINADLSVGLDLSLAKRLPENAVADAVARLNGLAEDLMKSSGIPGMAVAVVHGG